MKTIIISLGGSVIVPEEINVSLLKEFRGLVYDVVAQGFRVAIICGGGSTNKKYNLAATKITKVADEDLDWIGIKATKLNAELVRAIFGKDAYGVIDNPEDSIKTDKQIIIGAGYEPGCSSDMDAVLLAQNLGAKKVINMSNIDYVYTKDPQKYKDAKPIQDISWEQFHALIGDIWTPRLNAPFDPIASKKAKELGLEVAILNGNKLDNLKQCILGKPFTGTRIK
ncbi:UMP kinase [Candidatus Woesearchaeota archaeon]|nr:UMP kinase [Candidatus Woesearchaeota archaeon]